MLILAGVWLALCVAASAVSPLRVKYLALFSITAPFAIALNALLFCFALFMKRRWRAVVPLLALLSAYRIIPQVFGLHPFPQEQTKAQDAAFKVMSWNVHGMGIFERSAAARAINDDSIMAVLKAESPDIMCLAEFYTTYNNALKPYSTGIMRAGGYKEFRFQYDNTLGTKVYLGTAVFSRFPVSGYKAHSLHRRPDGQDDVVLLQFDVRLPDSTTLRVFFTHLQSFLLSDREKTYLEEVAHRDEEVEVSRSKTFMLRFGEAYVKRAIQADSAAEIIARSPYPVILCGDFNDLPASYTYTKMLASRRLSDAFARGGAGLGRTYNLFSPTLRIDYIFYDAAALRLLRFRTLSSYLSDHNAVVSEFKVAPGSGR